MKKYKAKSVPKSQLRISTFFNKPVPLKSNTKENSNASNTNLSHSICGNNIALCEKTIKSKIDDNESKKNINPEVVSVKNDNNKVSDIIFSPLKKRKILSPSKILEKSEPPSSPCDRSRKCDPVMMENELNNITNYQKHYVSHDQNNDVDVITLTPLECSEFDNDYEEDSDNDKCPAVIHSGCSILKDLDISDLEDIKAEFEDLDLSEWQKCAIVSIETTTISHIVRVKSVINNMENSCTIKDFWKNTTLEIGNIISIMAIKDDKTNNYCVSNEGGYLVLWPDTLVTGTEIVGSVFCMRKSILQRNFAGIDSNNKNMVIGTLIHELLQLCLRNQIYKSEHIILECENMLKNISYLNMLYDANLSHENTISEMKKFVPHISEFVEKYILSSNSNTNQSNKSINNKSSKIGQKCNWNGNIDEIIDIEENIWSPTLGISGRIDVTIKATSEINSKFMKKGVMPLELKTGRATNSIEHRGQVILYTMIMSLLDNDKNLKEINEGLLLYLREGIQIQHITSNYCEKRDLIILRNQLSYYIEKWRTSFLVNKEINESNNGLVLLPDPINHHSACGKCPYLTLCSTFLNQQSESDISADHPLIKLKEEAIGHLTKNDIDYFLHWCKLISIESSETRDDIEKKDIWNVSPSEREKRGKCLCNMKLVSVKSEKNGNFLHRFQKYSTDAENIAKNILQSQFQLGDYVVISTNRKFAETSGFITGFDGSQIAVSLNKDLSKRNVKSTQYHIDSYNSSSISNFNLTNIGLLMDNTKTCDKLRRIIVNRMPAQNNEKLSKKIVEKGREIFETLNSVQLKAVLKTLSAEDYILIKGMPGTGKTHTIVALVELLTKLNMSVLITSHTHSAVDTIFLKLKKRNLKMLRLGPVSRIHEELHAFTETALTSSCDSLSSLENFYNNINIIGVTCLGSNHPLLNKRTFDVCIVDESTQVLQCSVLRPLICANKFVLVGDPDQLPPIVKSHSARLLGMDESLFARLDNPSATVSLTIQYRMNKNIMELANRLTYDGQLMCDDKNTRNAVLNLDLQKIKQPRMFWLEQTLSPSIENSVVLIDTGNTSAQCENINNNQNYKQTKYTNTCEAVLILHILKTLFQNNISGENIGIIAPYRNQVLHIRDVFNNTFNVNKLSNDLIQDKYDVDIEKMCKRIEINTVDQYQGKDKHVIIYSCTKTWKTEQNDNVSRENQILEDKRRLTVAITRAKCKLVIIGDTNSLNSYKPFKQLFECLMSKQKICNIISLPDLELTGKFSWTDVINICDKQS